MSEPRHSRQVRLDEVGDAGQARIAAIHATVAGEGIGAVVEARYLAGAGVRRLACASESVGNAARAVDSHVAVALAFPSETDDDAPDFGIRDATARDVALGAWRALDAIRRAVREVPK